MSVSKKIGAVLIAGLATAWFVQPVAAQAGAEVQEEGPAAAAAQETPTTTADSRHRAEDLIGMDVKDSSGEAIGSVNDLVMGMHSGELRYAALSIGGFLGIGDKLIAVPFQSLSVQHETDDADAKFIAVNVDEEKLKAAEGFDQENWPDVANPQWGADIDRHFGVDQPERTVAPGDATTEQSRNGGPTAPSENQERDPAYRVSAIRGMAVKNAANDELGEIEDLMFDVEKRKVHYAALSFTDAAGGGEKLFAIPWGRFTLHQATGADRFLVLDLTSGELKTAEGFDKEKWPDAPAERWAEAPTTGDETLR